MLFYFDQRKINANQTRAEMAELAPRWMMGLSVRVPRSTKDRHAKVRTCAVATIIVTFSSWHGHGPIKLLTIRQISKIVLREKNL